jgi:hypothetical protein
MVWGADVWTANYWAYGAIPYTSPMINVSGTWYYAIDAWVYLTSNWGGTAWGQTAWDTSGGWARIQYCQTDSSGTWQ